MMKPWTCKRQRVGVKHISPAAHHKGGTHEDDRLGEGASGNILPTSTGDTEEVSVLAWESPQYLHSEVWKLRSQEMNIQWFFVSNSPGTKT